MSNLTIFNQGGEIAAAPRRESLLGKAFAKSSSTRRIQLSNAKVFKRIIDGEVVGKSIRGELNVMIVAALPEVSREYYAQAYSPDNKPSLPDCWSNRGDKPEAGSPNPQAASCAMCPKNVEGSGSGPKNKACRFNRRIAVVVHGDPDHEIYQLKIPSKSIFGKGIGREHPFNNYSKFLAGNKYALDTVLTKVSYKEDVEGIELIFSPERALNPEELAIVEAAQQDPNAFRYCMITAAQLDGAPAPQAAPKASSIFATDEEGEDTEIVFAPAAVKATPPKPVNVFEDDEEEEEPKPVKRAAKKAEPAPAPTKNLADVIDAWGDEDD